eukprot:31136-Pelagococcus_subviridis.AAC.3
MFALLRPQCSNSRIAQLFVFTGFARAGLPGAGVRTTMERARSQRRREAHKEPKGWFEAWTCGAIFGCAADERTNERERSTSSSSPDDAEINARVAPIPRRRPHPPRSLATLPDVDPSAPPSRLSPARPTGAAAAHYARCAPLPARVFVPDPRSFPRAEG